jgi:hypothetical protein
MFTGIMLSDGYIRNFKSKSGKTYFELKQFSEHKSLLDIVKTKFNEINLDCKISEFTYYNKILNNTYYWSTLSTKSNKELGEQRKRWYPNGIKIVPRDLKLNAEILAYLIMGDGSTYRGGIDKHSVKVSLYTNSFTQKDVDFLREKLKELGIESTTHKKIKNQPIILISKATSVTKLMDMIKPYIIPCFHYKIQYPNLIDFGDQEEKHRIKQSEYYHRLSPEVKKQRNRQHWENVKDKRNPERKDKYHSNTEYRQKCIDRSNRNYVPHPRIQEIKICNFCQSSNTRKYGKIINKSGSFQRFKCNDCSKVFREDKTDSCIIC